MSIKLTNVVDYMIKQDKLVNNLKIRVRDLESENESLKDTLDYIDNKYHFNESDELTEIDNNRHYYFDELTPDELDDLRLNLIDETRESKLRKYAVEKLYDESICEWKLSLSGSLDENGKVVYDKTEEEFFKDALVNNTSDFSMDDLKLILKDKLHEVYLKYCKDVDDGLLEEETDEIKLDIPPEDLEF